MSYAIGQSQTPWDVSISEVDLPPNLHFNRWGPVSGLGQLPDPANFNFLTPILNTVDPLNLFHNKPPPAAPAPQNSMASLLPLAVGGVVVAGVLWYVLKK